MTTSKWNRMIAAIGFSMVVAASQTACVRRTMKITTTPANSLVFINDEEVGRSEVATDFLWYGDYDVVIRKKGFETLKTNWTVKRPWYQYIPFDFMVEVLTPRQVHDVHIKHFTLSPKVIPTPQELLDRAERVRRDAVSTEPKKKAG